MSDAQKGHGSTHITEEQRQRTESLADGTPDGDSGESDTSSGGAPEAPEKNDPDGTPVENPSG